MSSMTSRRRYDGRVASIQALEHRWYQTAVAFESHTIECCTPFGVHSVAVGDLDGDRHEDVVVASWRENTVAWYKKSPDGRFGTRTVISSTVQGANAVHVIDMDRDGDLDIAVSANALNRVSWFENVKGQGSFVSHRGIDFPAPNSITFAEFDGDGDWDLLVTSSKQQTATWFKNLGGVFGSAHALAGQQHGESSAQAADLDGDQDVDVVIATPDDDTIAWYENVGGQGTVFERHLVSNTFHKPLAMALGDLDSDGDLDLVAASFETNTIAWYENLGGRGLFQKNRIVTTQARGVTHVVTADIDRDGDLDIVSTSFEDDTVAWFENEGFTFQRRVASSRIKGARDVVLADLDQDGDLDLVSAGFASGQLTWHEQRMIGDINGDHLFDHADLTRLFEIGEFEDHVTNNSTFDEGDWDGDGEFTTRDLILAMESGLYSLGPIA